MTVSREPAFTGLVVVDLHVTARCNMACGYCFSTTGASRTAPETSVFAPVRTHGAWRSDRAFVLMDDIYAALTRHGAERVSFNFTGGEPALIPNLGALRDHARALGAGVSFTSNGLMLQPSHEGWDPYLWDSFGFTVDSTNPRTNLAIGRVEGDGRQLDVDALTEVLAPIPRAGGPAIKINTTVTKDNAAEDIFAAIAELNPHTWKILKMLPVHSTSNVPTDEQYLAYVARQERGLSELFKDKQVSADHRTLITTEADKELSDSHVMVDHLGRFFRYGGVPGAGYLTSDPIQVRGDRPGRGAEKAGRQIGLWAPLDGAAWGPPSIVAAQERRLAQPAMLPVVLALHHAGKRGSPGAGQAL